MPQGPSELEEATGDPVVGANDRGVTRWRTNLVIEMGMSFWGGFRKAIEVEGVGRGVDTAAAVFELI